MHAKDSYTEPIQLGSIVEVRYTQKDFKQQLRVVPPGQADPLQGRMSVLSPLARAILGKTAGDTVNVYAPGGLLRIQVTGVDNTGIENSENGARDPSDLPDGEPPPIAA